VNLATVCLFVCQPATVRARRTRDAALRFAVLAHEFPTVALDVQAAEAGAITPPSTIAEERWKDRNVDFAPFDNHIDDLAARGKLALVVHGPPDRAARTACEMLTRWQRWIGRRNAASTGPKFDALLARLRAAHDLDKPLVRADWHHAIDTWQWMLRLDPAASREAQLSALLHDVERLESEADRRVEHLAPSYTAFKQEHAARGAQLARQLLGDCGFDRETSHRVAWLVAAHERTGDDPERALLNDADALSFFSQNSAGYFDYFGPEQSLRKIAYSLGRMRPAARRRLATMRLRADVARGLDEVRRRRERESTRRDGHGGRSAGGMNMWGIVPAAGTGSRIQPLAFSKELLPVGSRGDGNAERPRAVSEYVLERMAVAGVSRICIVVSPGKSDIVEYFGAAYAGIRIVYVVQPAPSGLCDAIFQALPLVGDDDPLVVGLPDTVWFPTDGFRRLGAGALEMLLFHVERPELFDAVVEDDGGRIVEIEVKAERARSDWVWGAFKTNGSTLREMEALWRSRNRSDAYLGTLINAWIARGGTARAVRAGQAYVDVGTLHGYREAIKLLGASASTRPVAESAGGARWPVPR
jgi:dTDP-glucose pyrophosphorylase